MEKRNKTAIILGATGLTGGILLKKLLNDTRYNRIKLFSRNSVGIDNPKIEEHIVDLFDLKLHKEDFVADEVYCCIGTTKSKTPDKSKYKAIDYGIPVAAAILCIENNIPVFTVISALGANPDSKIFYNRVKGKMEEEVMKLKIPKTYILQPSLISGKRDEKRAGEWIFKQLMKGLNYLLVGPLKKYKSVTPKTIVKAMINLANGTYLSGRIENDRIKEIAQEK
ncbi:Rossmann-fold NAD(P)-binding domain-containing protein [Galbibacter mesophilus]|uniref:nucleoside-diphosphate sugar epimerase n=1 Tax=Galbibacter mesophilus TaxID=379069 RepID=UPI00191EFEB6|nr:nucleoside-diphosphate sugar epimerase [Galbibacter mesophilus]MCM5661843.1 nucleoside-diphosphate sugar epimerase [Galbibacter mesophilus]